MSRGRFMEMVVGVSLAAALGMGGAALRFWHNADIRLAKIEQRQSEITDEKQDKVLSKHWKLHSWAKDEINELRFKAGLPKEVWPNLGD